MAELEQSELSMLSKLAAGKYTIESRMMLDVAVRRDGKVLFNDIALNDAALTKGAVAPGRGSGGIWRQGDDRQFFR